MDAKGDTPRNVTEVQQAYQHLSTSANSTQISDLNIEFSVPSLFRYEGLHPKFQIWPKILASRVSLDTMSYRLNL